MSLTKLYAILKDLEKKYNTTYHDLPMLKLYELEKEIKQVKQEIELQEEEEKKRKARLEQECERYSKEVDYSMASSMMREDIPARPVMNKRVVPVDDQGEPIQSLGGGKWVRK